MDGDLQNDPADIERLLAKLDEGYDVVSGWRVQRAERSILRTWPSAIANWLIGKVTGVELHDYGCSLKAYRADIVRETKLYGEMHRFLPALAHLVGASIAEIPVNHRPRAHGRSNYGLRRTFKVLLDLVTVKFLSYRTKPIYVFGGSGLLLCFLGIAAGAETLYMKYAHGAYVHRNPFILLAVLLFWLGVNFILMGLLAELIIRTYHESQSRPTYSIREVRNLAVARDADR
jgi:glycosyltransferase involved in cell wall biosynthesis